MIFNDYETLKKCHNNNIPVGWIQLRRTNRSFRTHNKLLVPDYLNRYLQEYINWKPIIWYTDRKEIPIVRAMLKFE